MRIIFRKEEDAFKREITNLKNEIESYKRMASHNHHIVSILCDKGRGVLNSGLLSNEEKAQRFHALSKAINGALGLNEFGEPFVKET